MRHVQKWPRPMTCENSRIDGFKDPMLFARLLWDERVLVDKGPSPAGNPGPYLHVYDDCGDEACHRVYPEPRWLGKVEPVKLENGKWAWAKKAKESA